MTSQKENMIKWWTNFSRYALALVFAFSGFVKMIDPIGMQYKIEDYLIAFGLSDYFPSWLSLSFAVVLGVIEFMLGAYFLFGIRRQISTRLALFLLCFMTPLTLYIAIYNPVPDCGCFGDALVLTNIETFLKNIVLLVLVITTYRFSDKIIQWSTDRFQWLISLYVILFSFTLSLYSLHYLPLFDFRPFKIGVDIEKAMCIPEGEHPSQYEVRFLMEKEGHKKEFTVENYPDTTWRFVSRTEHLVKKGYEPSILDFSFTRLSDGVEITDSLLAYKGYTFLLIAHRLGETDQGNIDIINDIYDYSVIHHYKFYCLTSSGKEEIAEWRYSTGADYSFLLGDDILLKTIVRSNPGLLLLKDGVIYNKWSNADMPTEYDLNKPLDQLAIGNIPDEDVLTTAKKVIMWFFIPLALLCFLDILMNKRVNKKKDNKRDQ